LLLRNAGTPAPPQRRVILSDLASRLDALIRNVGPGAESLRELVAALAVLEGATALSQTDLDALWEKALRALDEFAGTTDSPAKRQFWKRS
jgi:hypothetical protein